MHMIQISYKRLSGTLLFHSGPGDAETSISDNLQELLKEQKGTALLNTTVDRPYNRTGFTLAAYEAHKVGFALRTL